MKQRMSALVNRVKKGFHRHWVHRRNDWHIRRMARNIEKRAAKTANQPVIFFNASTRLSGFNQNSAFSLLSSWGLRLGGIPVVYFACERGMSRCILGTDRHNPQKLPPCSECVAQSHTNFYGANTRWFTFKVDGELESALKDLSLDDLSCFQYHDIPLGELVLPSLRWVLRRHYLIDNEDTRYLFRHYIESAWNVAQNFEALVSEVKPSAVVVFNGITFPEAVARWVARQHEIKVITHEVSLQPFSAFFTSKDATFRTFSLPEGFRLNRQQDEQLDQYLQQRFKGNFTMAGVQFWKEMRSLGEEFWQRASAYKQIVPVFTNVIFDTSQFHANTVFDDMFAWLDLVLEIIRTHPETFFVIRAHPDEERPGKESLDSVAGWVEQHHVAELANVLFVPPRQYFSSYELIQKSKFTMTYTSTIGLEATLMGAPVLCGGHSQYNQIPTAFFMSTPEGYRQKAEEFLTAEKIDVPADYILNARKFLYYSLYHASLPFGEYIQNDGVWQGYVTLKPFAWQQLLPENSPVIHAVLDGLTSDRPFALD